MAETATASTTTTDDEQLLALEGERARAALAVRNGVPGAEQELKRIKRKIFELNERREDAALAEREEQREQVRQRERAEADKLQAQVDQLAHLEQEEGRLEAKVLAQIDALAPLVAELIETGLQAYSLRQQLYQRGKWRTVAKVADYLKNKLPRLALALEGPHVKDRIGRPEADGPEVPAQHDEVVELMPEPPGPPLTSPSEGLHSTRPSSTSEEGKA